VGLLDVAGLLEVCGLFVVGGFLDGGGLFVVVVATVVVLRVFAFALFETVYLGLVDKITGGSVLFKLILLKISNGVGFLKSSWNSSSNSYEVEIAGSSSDSVPGTDSYFSTGSPASMYSSSSWGALLPSSDSSPLSSTSP